MALTLNRSCLGALLLSTSLVLAACKSSEERAQDHFESGVALLEQGDVDRARVEFQNVFRLDPQNVEARLVFANALLENGEQGKAYRQFLRVSEQSPDNAQVRIELAEMAIVSQNWEEGKRHGEAAIELAADNQRVQVIAAALEYAQARRDNESDVAGEAATRAQDLLQVLPDNLVAMRTVIDHLIRNQNYQGALEIAESGIASHPDNFAMHSVRLQLQANLQDLDGLGDTLKEMVERFPNELDIQRMLIRWHLDRQDLDGAEDFLRELAARPDAGSDEKITVVRFLMQARDSAAAQEELRRLIAEEEETVVYHALLATLDFQEGQPEKAIADLEALIANSEPSEELSSAKVVLARMLMQTDNLVGARARVEEVIEEDPTNTEALKMRANWLIDEDKPDDAINDLRAALSQEPRDADILTLMGRAHERAGARDLAGERYALAVDASDQAPEESLRYAAFLLREDRVDAAKAVLVEALDNAPRNMLLMQRLALLHQTTEDWNEVTRIVWRLRSLETSEATALANGLEADMMLRQNRLEDTVEFLSELVEEESYTSDAALAALIQTKIRAGEISDVVDMLEDRLDETPDDNALRYLRAGVHLIQDERDEAADIYRALLEVEPGNRAIMRTLHAVLVAEGQHDQATAMVEEQIKAAENPSEALLLKAEDLERAGDFEGAIAIYDELYALNSNNVVIANNLASLITTHRDAPEDLDRAFNIARRLSSSDFPAFQDTYGWIEYRRGNYEEALKYLEPAARGLPNHPLVQYHLGMTYVALDQIEQAKSALERSLELAGDAPLPQYDRAREVLDAMETPE